MSRVKDLVAAINSAEVKSPHYLEDEVDMGGVEEVATIKRDEHRWYVVGTIVFKVGDEFIGVRGPISLKSEEMDYDAVGMKCEAFEMKQVPTVTYERIKEEVKK